MKLTPRQTQIVKLIGAGKSLQGVARELKLSPITVRTSIYAMRKRTGERSLAVIVYKQEQIERN